MKQHFRASISETVTLQGAENGLVVRKTNVDTRGESQFTFEDAAGNTDHIDRAIDQAIAVANTAKDQADQMIADLEAKRTELKDAYNNPE